MDWKAEGYSRFQVWYDQLTSTFRILDAWDDSIKNIDQNALNENLIPDSSPAVKILTTEEVNALVGKIKDLGWLDKYMLDNSDKKISGSEIKTILRTPTLHEVAIKEISNVANLEIDKHDASVSKEAISAIRSILDRV